MHVKQNGYAICLLTSKKSKGFLLGNKKPAIIDGGAFNVSRIVCVYTAFCLLKIEKRTSARSYFLMT